MARQGSISGPIVLDRNGGIKRRDEKAPRERKRGSNLDVRTSPSYGKDNASNDEDDKGTNKVIVRSSSARQNRTGGKSEEKDRDRERDREKEKEKDRDRDREGGRDRRKQSKEGPGAVRRKDERGKDERKARGGSGRDQDAPLAASSDLNPTSPVIAKR
jgi:hypothetical protein